MHDEYIKEWEAKNAGCKVAPEVVGWDQCQDKATTLAAAGTPVGLAYVGSRTLKQFAPERPDRADPDDRRREEGLLSRTSSTP